MRKICFVIILFLIFLVGCTNEKVKPIPSSTPTPTPTPIPVPDKENNQPQVEQDPVEQVKPAIDTSKLGKVFGFSGVKGQQILVTGLGMGQEDVMLPLNKAIGANGEVVPIKYLEWQEGNEELNNGRDLSINMANMPGYLFTVEEGSVQEDQTYYLINDAQFDTGALLAIQVKNELVSDEQLLSQLQAIHDRKIEQAWTLAEIEDTDELYLVHFETVGEEHLFSLVLKRGDKFIVKDYPETQKETTSVWRVDDGGEISADNFSMMFAVNTSDGILLSLNWWGFEGVNSIFLLEQDQILKELETRYGRYTFPI
ncbi:hypothetical protein EJP82_02800 [Paenibacillus anaericanus]|uniref:Uncharacterized protein n=1 Tax=Paenibacillus anaericanus TaxID=170367 RepID=A0A3S1DMU4_9BACL|nr:hypothetical protein [Paenibacillus anaericanus]RUT48087.1 hypothetical protein EJP82_02800 [Paenibacillus anaericanus]